MSLDEILSRARDHYVEQLTAFVRELRANGKRGGAEVKLQLSEDSPLFQRLYCLDYIENDAEGVRPIDMLPDRLLRFDPASFKRRAVTIHVESICWDDVQLSFDGTTPNLDAWFGVWFDPEEKNFDATAELSGRIHSLGTGNGLITVDFGSAPAQALLELIDVLGAAGVREIVLRTSRQPESSS